jgi:hypothetical protein
MVSTKDFHRSMESYLYSPRMPSSCAILVSAAIVPLYGIAAPALIPWVCKIKHIGVDYHFGIMFLETILVQLLNTRGPKMLSYFKAC